MSGTGNIRADSIANLYFSFNRDKNESQKSLSSTVKSCQTPRIPLSQQQTRHMEYWEFYNSDDNSEDSENDNTSAQKN